MHRVGVDRIKIQLAGVIVALAAVAVGSVVAVWTMPSEDEFVAAAADELGIPASVVESPLVAPFVQELAADVRGRAVREARGALAAGVATTAVVILVAATISAMAAGGLGARPFRRVMAGGPEHHQGRWRDRDDRE